MLPAAAGIRKQGANKGAVTAFLISTPESGVDSIAISYALLDPLMTVVRPVAAFFTATFAGMVENTLFWDAGGKSLVVDRSCPVDGCCDGVDCPDEIHRKHHTLGEKLLAGLRFGYNDVWGDIAGWFFVGVAAAALITVVVPEDVVIGLLGGGFSSMVIMLLVGIPIYICATASTPVAAALIMKGVSPGAALVFLLVGPATNITSLSVLFGILGKKSTAVYLIVLSICAIAAGLAVDAMYASLQISPRAVLGQATELVPGNVKFISALFLAAISVKPLWAVLKKKLRKKQGNRHFVSPFPGPMDDTIRKN